MTDKEKRAIEMFYGIKEPIRLYNKKLGKYFIYTDIVIGGKIWVSYGTIDGDVDYHNLDNIDLYPPKTAYDELVEIEDPN
jgi:hypothetical protein